MHPKELIPTSATKPPKYKVGDCVSLKEKYLMELKEISPGHFTACIQAENAGRV